MGFVISASMVLLQAGAVYADVGVGIARLTSLGALDGSFDSDGRVTSDPHGDNTAWGAHVIPFSGGKSVFVGRYEADDGYRGIIGRYNDNGSPDTSFGWLGVNTLDYSTSTDETLYAVGNQSTLKIVVAGTANGSNSSSVFAARFNTNGSLDTTFGSSGLATAFTNAEAFDLSVDGSNKIVVAGSWDSHVGLARFTSNGTLDGSFSTDGRVKVTFGTPFSEAAHSVDHDGSKIVIAGYAHKANTHMGVMRFNSDGSLDAGFGSSGKVTIDYPGTTTEVAFGVDCWPQVGCFVVGQTKSSSGLLTITRLTSTGAINSSWGLKTLGFVGATHSHGTDVRVTNDNKVVVGGGATVSGVKRLAAARYSMNGVLDPSFSSNGQTTFAFSGVDIKATAMSLDPPTGKIVIAGNTE